MHKPYPSKSSGTNANTEKGSFFIIEDPKNPLDVSRIKNPHDQRVLANIDRILSLWEQTMPLLTKYEILEKSTHYVLRYSWDDEFWTISLTDILERLFDKLNIFDVSFNHKGMWFRVWKCEHYARERQKVQKPKQNPNISFSTLTTSSMKNGQQNTFEGLDDRSPSPAPPLKRRKKNGPTSNEIDQFCQEIPESSQRATASTSHDYSSHAGAADTPSRSNSVTRKIQERGRSVTRRPMTGNWGH